MSIQPAAQMMSSIDDSGYQGFELPVPIQRDFWHSQQINEVAMALAKAQGAIEGALKDTANPFFRSKYADLASIWNAARKPLADNGIAIVQMPSARRAEATVVTMLVHSSGQFFASSLTMTAYVQIKEGPIDENPMPQGIGSVITYARRYALAAMVGVAPEDDDANNASARGQEQAAMQRNAQPPRTPVPVNQPRPTAVKTESSSESAMLNDMATTGGSLKVFAKLKDGLVTALGKEAGERLYYSKLGLHGVEHANEFKQSVAAKACAKDMLGAIHSAEGLGV